MIKANNTEKKCFIACDEQRVKDGNCSCVLSTNKLSQEPIVRYCVSCNNKLIVHNDNRQYCPNMKCNKDFQ